MKKLIFISIGILFALTVIYSKTAKDVFTSNSITFFGLDFTKAKCVGTGGFNDPKEIVEKFFAEWNQLFYKEQGKYDLRKFFHKENVEYSLDMIENLNSKVSPSNLITTKPPNIDNETIQKIVGSYMPSQKEGIGLVLIVESLDKESSGGTFYVVFFDIATKHILLSEKVFGKAGGFGFRNFWAKAFFIGLRECEKRYYDWERTYSK